MTEPMSTSPGAVLRQSVSDPSGAPLAIVGAPHALAGRLIESSGFQAAYLSGAAFSAGLLGVPDIGLFSLEDLAKQAAILSRSIDIPLVVDADTGFGPPEKIGSTVRRLEEAGAAAIQIEDQTADKRCGHLAGKSVIPANEMCQKIAAACQGRNCPDTVIIGRTDARATDGIDNCIARCLAYRQAGADWIFPEALRSEEEFREVAAAMAGSGAVLLANMTEFGVGPLLSVDQLSAAGFQAVLYPVTLLRLAMKAMEAGLAVLADEGSQESLLDLMQTREELYDLLAYDPADPDSWHA
jgi:methylisocitrate lyase